MSGLLELEGSIKNNLRWKARKSTSSLMIIDIKPGVQNGTDND